MVGGVNLILGPEVHVNFSKAGMMAADGRCKTFDASADGYVRGEGGLPVGAPAARCAGGWRPHPGRGPRQRDQPGRPQQRPDGAQRPCPGGRAARGAGRCGRQACRSRLCRDPRHRHLAGGSDRGQCARRRDARGPRPGAPVGDWRDQDQCRHLEAAAGLLGVAKAVLVLRRGEIPPHLHLNTPNPLIDWPALRVTVPTVVTRWAAEPQARVAGVSSFGFSGTNAHVVLQEPPATPPSAAPGGTRPGALLVLSARDDVALAALVERHRAALHTTQAAISLKDWCHTAAVGRDHLPSRLTVQAASVADLDAALGAWQSGQATPAIVHGHAAARAPRVAFLFPGQGPQYLGMGRDLYETAPAFREAFDRCAEALDGLLPQPLREVVFAGGAQAALLDETRYAQPAMFAIEVALASLWRSFGVEPVAVMGHSFGEYAAAHVAGVLTLADAARMVAARGRLAQGLPRDGAMVVLEAAESAVSAAIAAHAGRVAIAAVNGDTNVVISGERTAVEQIAAGFAAQGARTKPLRVSHAFHSPLMDPVLADFEREVAGASFAEPRIALVSNLSAERAGLSLLGHAGYWRRHLREPVRFADAMRTLAAEGITHYIELSPQPVLLGMGADCGAAGNGCPRCAKASRAGRPCSSPCSTCSWPVPPSTGVPWIVARAAGASSCPPTRSSGGVIGSLRLHDMPPDFLPRRAGKAWPRPWTAVPSADRWT
ncbi:type I polyketide synthase [Piscinibacter aquaticus]|uniref:Type I polyketide synthase n=1 Tax=Piscinibacter aquaticus TaxID=392597 RepID=A0A5C6TZL1_9BURK|nr:type I polyketide synthase [Piscinibacter aquaticus]